LRGTDGEVCRPVVGQQLLLYLVDLGGVHLQSGCKPDFVVGHCREKEGEGLHSIIELLSDPCKC